MDCGVISAAIVAIIYGKKCEKNPWGKVWRVERIEETPEGTFREYLENLQLNSRGNLWTNIVIHEGIS